MQDRLDHPRHPGHHRHFLAANPAAAKLFELVKLPVVGVSLATVLVQDQAPGTMLANAPGFLALYERREIHFEETYRDILLRAFVPQERGRIPRDRERLLRILRDVINGRVTTKNEEFYLRNKDGNLEFSLLAEGFRKLGLLWLMIRNGTLLDGSVLFWDGRAAQPIYLSSLASDCGVSQPTAKAWLSILEAGFVAFRLPSLRSTLDTPQQRRDGQLIP
ncbi:MAG: hypothetical protein OXC06_05915 [Acidimicrobiaceae bacterium]|nr:hypothetical protein [Acidimicrobiaceae bacterium]